MCACCDKVSIVKFLEKGLMNQTYTINFVSTMDDPSSKAIIKSFENTAKKGFDMLDLNRNGIQQIPQGLSGLDLSHLKYLYLEGNSISFLPGDFFTCLQGLEWLDLRKNKIQEISPNVGEHKNLKTLLLGENKLKFLPVELGFIRTLTGLNLSENPLKDPPQTVIDRGVHAIKHYLLTKLASFTPEYLQSDGTDSDYQSTESHQDDKDQAEARENNASMFCSSNQQSDPAATELQPAAVCSREVMSYYGALLGDIPTSYIFKPWKTGVFFKKEEDD